MRVALCMPCGDTIMTDCATSMWAQLAFILRERKDISLFLINEKQTILEVGRHRLVMEAMKLRAQAILFVDSDMVFSYDSLSRLVDADKDIIGVQAVMRAEPHASNCYDFDDKPVLYSDEIKKIKYIGTGLILVKTHVFEKIGLPYFKSTYNKDNGRWQGEDLNFCDRAREAGFDIWNHGPLSKKLEHIGSKKYGFESTEEKKNALR